MDIPTAIATISSSIGLVKSLHEASAEIDKAELRLKTVNLLDQLVSAKASLVDARERIISLEAENAKLRDTAEKIADLIDVDGFKYRKSKDGQPLGQPYCPRCLEVDGNLVSLQISNRLPDWERACPQCKNDFLVDKAARDQEEARQEAAMRNYRPPSY